MIRRALPVLLLALAACDHGAQHKRIVDRFEIEGEAPWCSADMIGSKPDGSRTPVACHWLSEQHCKTGAALDGRPVYCVPRP